MQDCGNEDIFSFPTPPLQLTQGDPEQGLAKVPLRRRLKFFGPLASPIFLQAFSLTFLAEWGDRSQLTTIILGAREVRRLGVFDCIVPRPTSNNQEEAEKKEETLSLTYGKGRGRPVMKPPIMDTPKEDKPPNKLKDKPKSTLVYTLYLKKKKITSERGQNGKGQNGWSRKCPY